MTAPATMPPLPDGYTLYRFDTLDGTNEEALRAGAPPKSVYLSRCQTAGRGRHGRGWQSPDGNLYATICTQPPANRNPAQLAFVAGLAVLDAVSEMAPDAEFSLKWPNDILAGGRKISGMLIEAGDVGFAVGIGINIVSSPQDDEVRYPATNLQDFAGQSPDTEILLVALCRHFDNWHRRWSEDGFEPLRAVWLASAHRIGDTIAASTGVDRIEGRFQGLDADGALVLEDAGGLVHVVTAGDVFFPGAD
jgi:BirA family transcriptional regulator, biotin operon repressor / biotin---[acetyl-CoA-carboxylase] ligase